jgi:hypothetical protein
MSGDNIEIFPWDGIGWWLVSTVYQINRFAVLGCSDRVLRCAALHCLFVYRLQSIRTVNGVCVLVSLDALITLG